MEGGYGMVWLHAYLVVLASGLGCMPSSRCMPGDWSTHLVVLTGAWRAAPAGLYNIRYAPHGCIRVVWNLWQTGIASALHVWTVCPSAPCIFTLTLVIFPVAWMGMQPTAVAVRLYAEDCCWLLCVVAQDTIKRSSKKCDERPQMLATQFGHGAALSKRLLAAEVRCGFYRVFFWGNTAAHCGMHQQHIFSRYEGFMVLGFRDLGIQHTVSAPTTWPTTAQHSNRSTP